MKRPESTELLRRGCQHPPIPAQHGDVVLPTRLEDEVPLLIAGAKNTAPINGLAW